MDRRLSRGCGVLVCALALVPRGDARGDEREVGVRLGSRMTPVDVRLPQVPRGASAPFRWRGPDGVERAGWVAVLPQDALVPSPSYGGGLVHVSGGFSSHEVFAFDGRTGRSAWRASAPDGGPSAAIVVGDKVLFNTESCTLFCVDAATGRELWKKWLGDPLMSQPASDGRLVFSAHIAGAGQYRLTALRIADGGTAWSETIDTDALSAPVIANGHVLLTTMGGHVVRFDAATGRRAWDVAVEATSAPWVDGGRVYVARRAPGGREQQIVLAVATGELLQQGTVLAARYAAGRPDAGGVAAGWGYEGSRPVLAAGRAYYAMGQELRARDLETGEEVWRRSMGSGADARGLTPPAIVGGTAVVGTRTGELYGIDIDTGLATFALSIGEPIAWQPIVAKGWVYLTTTHGRLVGLEVSDEAFDGWHMWGGSPAHLGPVATRESPRPAAAPVAAVARPGEGSLQTEIDGRRERFPLTATRVRTRVSGFVARTELEQTFDNPFDQPLDAAYVFPLPPDAAVDEMVLSIGTRVVRGRIARRVEARRVFMEARARGALAALLETESAELFRQAVANVPPHTAVHVRLSYSAVLPYHDGAYHLSFPMVAAPRYTSDGSGALAGATAVPADDRSAREIDLAVEIDAGVPLESVESPTHRIRATRQGPTRARVTLAAGDRLPNRDFALDLGVAGDAPRVAALATAERGEGTVSVLVHPRARTPEDQLAPREVVLLVDASSSMRGRPLEQARAVSAAVLASLRATDTFRLVAFSDRAQSLDTRALPPTPEALAAARMFLGRVTPRGGTELARALDAAFTTPQDPARVRLVVLASDGLVGREGDVLAQIAARLGGARLYGLGLGAAPNHFLLERACQAGRGEALYAALGDEPGEVATRLARRIDHPVLTELAIDWGGLPVHDVYPAVLPDLHADRPLLVHARYSLADAPSGPVQSNVTVSGRVAGRPWSARVPLALPADATEHRALGAVWARARVADLETAALLAPTPALREQIAETGLTFGLVTRETSFVAVDDRSQQERGGRSTSFADGAAGSTGGGGSYDFADDEVQGELLVERDLPDDAGIPGAERALGRAFRLHVGALVAYAPPIAEDGWARVPVSAGLAATVAFAGALCLDARVLSGMALPIDGDVSASLALRTDHRVGLCPRLGPVALLVTAGPALALDEGRLRPGLSGGLGALLAIGRLTLRQDLDVAWLGAPSVTMTLGFGVAL